MLRYIYGDDLGRFPVLAEGMFRDRAAQFAERLGWKVCVDAYGHERDAYDALNPLYVIWEGEGGAHQGSMRFLPTTGRTMVNEHFRHLMGGGTVESPLIWECTRFCLAPGAGAHVAAGLMLGGGEIMRNFGVRHFVGVFDARMVRIYRRIGAEPEVLGSMGEGRTAVSVGLWAFSPAARARVAAQAGVLPEVSDRWFRESFYPRLPGEVARSA
ncbi:MAG: acyl-homoserine-lactone synthase [Roseovarius sp.]